jgi:hypothetical protein
MSAMEAPMEAQPYLPKPKNNSMAITSMVSSIVGWAFVLLNLCLNWVILPAATVITMGLGGFLYCIAIPLVCISPIGWIVGIITGHVADGQIKQTGEGGSGMAKAGLIMGYIGLGLFVIGLCLLAVATVLSVLGVVSIPIIDSLVNQR